MIYQVKELYSHLQYFYTYEELLKQQDSIFKGFLKSADLRYQTGESTILESVTAKNELEEVRNRLQQNRANINIQYAQLKVVLGSNEPLSIAEKELKANSLNLDLDSNQVNANPYLAYLKQQIELSDKQKSVEVAKSLPDIRLGYFNQSLIGNQTVNGQDLYFDGSKRFQGVQIGLSVPLFYGSYRSKIKASNLQSSIASQNLAYQQQQIQSQYQQLVQEYLKQKTSIEYFEASALPNMKLIEKNSQIAYQNGEISYQEHLLNLKNTVKIRENYLSTLLQLNQSINKITYLIGNTSN